MNWHIPQYDPERDAEGYRYDAELADCAVDFFEKALKHPRGTYAGEPFTLLDWQLGVTRCIYGWVHVRTGLRRYRKVYIEVPRKNGKTTYAAGLSLYMLKGKRASTAGEQGLECYSAAGTRDQASLLFRAASGMVKRQPKLLDKCQIRTSTKTIFTDDNESFLRSIPSDGDSVHGQDAWSIVGDEFHVWKNLEFYNGLVTSGGSRSEPLIVFITTAGWDRNSLCWKEHVYADQVRKGIIHDPTYLPVIWGAPEEADWESEETWAQANPSLGQSVKVDFLRTEYRKAKNQPSYQNTFRRLYLNQWTSQETRFLDMGKWRSCTVVDGIQDGEGVWGGLDLSATTDLTSLCWMADRDGRKVAEWRFWIPGDRVHELASRDHVDYRTLIANGWVETCPGPAIDPNQIIRAVVEDAQKYNVHSVGYDPYMAELVRQALEDQGVSCHQVPQTITQMSAPTKELERLVLSDEISHNNNPVADWCAENVAIRTDANQNIRPVKPDYHSSPKKIDGIVALINALHSYDHVPAGGPSIYETPGGLSL